MENMVDYTFYTETYKGGAIPESVFERYARDAENNVNMMTFGRIHKYVLQADTQECVKMAICAVAERVYIYDTEREVSSETIGKMSRTYAQKSKTLDRQKVDAARAYLYDTGLLYRGLDDECHGFQ